MITASIILYKEDIEILKKTVDCFLELPLQKKLFLIDNSPDNNLENHFLNENIEYVFVGNNIGFGAAHNLIIDKITSEFHLILNPDVTFSSKVIPTLINKLKTDEKVAFISPQVKYPSGKLQYTCRKYPTFLELVFRKLNIFKKYTHKREYRDLDLSKPFYPEFIYGSFLLFKTSIFKEIKGFDTRYFLYMEDVDICRKIDAAGLKKLYYPLEEISHIHRKESSKKVKLFFYHLSSALKYFSKWGI